MPTDRDPRLQAAKRLTVLAQFMAKANDALEKQAKQAAKKAVDEHPVKHVVDEHSVKAGKEAKK